MKEEMKKKWYAVQIRNGFEGKILQHILPLMERHNINPEDIEFVIPTEDFVYYKNDEKKVKKKSLLPGYMLVATEEMTSILVNFIDNLPYVVGFVGVGRNPEQLKPHEVNNILSKMNRTNVSNIHIDFNIGEKVDIIDGPFADFVGHINEVKDGKIIVDVNVFGRATPIELNMTQVRRAKKNDEPS